jgi:hypothetical protein
MIDRFVVETLQTFGTSLRWPFLPYEIIAETISNFDHPVFRGRGIRYGDGKPLLMVPGHLSGDGALLPLRMWLRAIGYRPTRVNIPINLDDEVLDGPLAATLSSAARRIGRKAVVIAFGTGVRAALRVAAVEERHVSDIVALGLPDSLPTIPEHVRLHIIGRPPFPADISGEVQSVEGSNLLLHLNPDALRALSEILRRIPIYLLDGDGRLAAQ